MSAPVSIYLDGRLIDTINIEIKRPGGEFESVKNLAQSFGEKLRTRAEQRGGTVTYTDSRIDVRNLAEVIS